MSSQQPDTHNRNGIAYPTTPRACGVETAVDYPPNEISIPLFVDAWGFTYSIVDIANRGDTEKYPATLLISRMPPVYLKDMGHHFFALTFDDYLKANGQYSFGLPADSVEPHRIYPVSLSYQGIKYARLIDSIWQHHSGAFYRITHVANVSTRLEALPVTFFYKNVTTGERYAGLRTDWDRRMAYVCDGIKQSTDCDSHLRIEPAMAYIEGRVGGGNVFSFPPTIIISDSGRAVTKPVDVKHAVTLQQVLAQMLASQL